MIDLSNMKNHSIAVFIRVQMPTASFTEEQATAAAEHITKTLNENVWGNPTGPMEHCDGNYVIAYDCDTYGGVICDPEIEKIEGVFVGLSETYPEAKFDIMLEDEDEGQTQLVILFEDGKSEWDCTVTLEPTLNKVGQRPMSRTITLMVTEAQMVKIAALLKAEGVDWQ